MRKAIFLDRDGVINKAIIRGGKPFAPLQIEEFEIESTAKAAFRKFEIMGFVVAIVTNQPEISRGNLSIETTNEMHKILNIHLGIEHFYICRHDDQDNCNCRKPKPGLILQATRELNIDIKNSFLIGDRSSDIKAGQSAGCKSIWIDRNYAEKSPTGNFFRCTSLMEAVNIIVENQNRK